ncbi:MAG: hypothetical protein OWQ51_03750 [Pyrobaculum arsenaticum]|uniref:Uncharacterized protein n=1 Tax=Pyrobaculum arsenaticum (strain DSM 13514 / JCM 11321 / PZ6) TaxID=340102 RepID=A4WMV2_PYRAR|nr:hypothetical protein [Pyrobaculum arsenaticum]ABP51719.1 hypothetical protein Pars_2173 [Pyrobaculum arsenaticum DSM 13514]MCY0890087.1 hypothetical protein [Pyrobaculum arsenaticum]
MPGDGLRGHLLGNVKTFLLLAFIFAALFTAIVLAFAGVFTAAAPYAPSWAGIAGLLIALALLDVLVIARIYRMYKAAEIGDVTTLKSLNSLGWAIVALLFAGLIPGIMLILAHGTIEKLE